ncbi:hypothetical protein [Oceanospirillum beijerinckii]|uniref:hypothetical protein n=1 Tax=Oceanospirillum beijerinckii TaxID=64976 RepID=UPI0004033F50|nr:hypothetical protein [Oceanospirillum beijerinckii]
MTKDTSQLLSESISKYKDLLSSFEKEKSDIDLITDKQLPEAQEHLRKAQHGVSIEQSKLREAVSIEDIEGIRKALKVAEATFEDAELLVINLEKRIEVFNSSAHNKQQAINQALKDLWKEKHNQLCKKLQLDGDLLDLLREIIAAGDGMNPGWSIRFLSEPIKSKYGELDRKAITATQDQLLEQMGIK